MSKYHSKKIKTPDGVFDSKREYSRWEELKLMQDAGIIYNLKRQIPYLLVPKQVLKEPRMRRGRMEKSERAVYYIADFEYIENGQRVVEDSKGVRTPDYCIKRKLMLQVHGVQIREV